MLNILHSTAVAAIECRTLTERARVPIHFGAISKHEQFRSLHSGDSGDSGDSGGMK